MRKLIGHCFHTLTAVTDTVMLTEQQWSKHMDFTDKRHAVVEMIRRKHGEAFLLGWLTQSYLYPLSADVEEAVIDITIAGMETFPDLVVDKQEAFA
jgi:hypothetical protein